MLAHSKLGILASTVTTPVVSRLINHPLLRRKSSEIFSSRFLYQALRLANPIKLSIPEKNSHTAAGTGTEEIVPSRCILTYSPPSPDGLPSSI